MPWVQIPANRLADLPLFGIDLVADDGQFAWYRGSRGRMRIEKSDPRVFFDEAADAHQCGATSILIANSGPKSGDKTHSK
jgi:hypothetical protein